MCVEKIKDIIESKEFVYVDSLQGCIHFYIIWHMYVHIWHYIQVNNILSLNSFTQKHISVILKIKTLKSFLDILPFIWMFMYAIYMEMYEM